MVIDRDTALTIDWLERRRMMRKTITFNRQSAYDFIDEALNNSIGYTNEGILEDTHWSTPYTNEGKLGQPALVSKYMMNTTNEDLLDIRPVHVYFDRDIQKVGEFTQEVLDEVNNFPRRNVFCHSWSELSAAMKLSPKTIAFHETELKYTSAIEIVNMVRTLSKLVGIDDTINISVSITKDTQLKTIKELQKNEIHGIIPIHADFGWEETKKGLHALWNKIPYWPKHILDQLPGSKKVNIKTSEIKLTPRQHQILALIKERGASNKVIAKTLNITESTVKLHVGIVLKKFGVKNRTQLAVFSK